MSSTASNYLGGLSAILTVLQDNVTGDITAKDMRDIALTTYTDKQTIGTRINTIGDSSVAVGINNEASGDYSSAFGSNNIAGGIASHAEGRFCTASGPWTHTEGSFNVATQDSAHAEGYNTLASGYYAHSEGINTIASGDNSHAEGVNTIASGQNSHAEGNFTVASGINSHSEGYSTIASGDSSHAGGSSAEAYRYSEWARSSDVSGLSQYGFITHVVRTEGTGISTEAFCDAAGTHRFTLNSIRFAGNVYIYRIEIKALAISDNGSIFSASGNGIAKYDNYSTASIYNLNTGALTPLTIDFSDTPMIGC